ncbi:MAG: hypothetical protein NVSMB38_09290 [Ktedonobacteraceae bacterium]
MTLIFLTDCCRLLDIDPKTLRRWLDLAPVGLLPHPTDARIKAISAEQLHHIATAHRRMLTALSEPAPSPVQLLPPQEPPALSGELLDALQTIAELSAQIRGLQQRLSELTPLLPLAVLASPAKIEAYQNSILLRRTLMPFQIPL